MKYVVNNRMVGDLELFVRHPETNRKFESGDQIDFSNENPNTKKHFQRLVFQGDLIPAKIKKTKGIEK